MIVCAHGGRKWWCMWRLEKEEVVKTTTKRLQRSRRWRFKTRGLARELRAGKRGAVRGARHVLNRSLRENGVEHDEGSCSFRLFSERDIL